VGIEENKQVVADLFARFSAGDLAGALALLSDDATWWIAGEIEGGFAAGEHTKRQITRLLEGMGQQLTGGLRMTVHGLVAEGDRVAAEVSSYGELRNGKVYRNQYHFAFSLRGGRITAVREYLDTKHVEATWSPP
jgi:ketosteroid isomerase-like protein